MAVHRREAAGTEGEEEQDKTTFIKKMYFVKDALLDGDGNHHHTFAKNYDFCFRQRQSRARPTLPAPQLEHEMDQRLTLDREHLENSSSKKSLKGAGGQSKCSYIEVEAFSSPMQFVPGLDWWRSK